MPRFRRLRVVKAGFLQAISSLWDRLIIRRALLLAGEPKFVLDSPCGDGQLWPILAEKAYRRIYAADDSSEKLVSAWNKNSSKVVERVRIFHSSACTIDLPGESVDCILSMQPFHSYCGRPTNSRRLLEFHRITRDSLILAVEVERKPGFFSQIRGFDRSKGNADASKSISFSQIEDGFLLAGFTIQRFIVRLPPFDMRRTYILRKCEADIK